MKQKLRLSMKLTVKVLISSHKLWVVIKMKWTSTGGGNETPLLCCCFDCDFCDWLRILAIWGEKSASELRGTS